MKHGIYVTLFSDNTSDQHFAFLMFFRIRTIRDSDYNRFSAATTDYSYERQLAKDNGRKAWAPCVKNVERGGIQ